MKILLKIILLVFLSVQILPIVNDSYAADDGKITVTVTEKIPGASCGAPITNKKTKSITYECTVDKGFGTVIGMLGKIIKYFTFIAALGGVLALVIGGIMYSMGGADDNMKTKAKEFITKVIVGIIVLLFSGVILNTIAPWVYK